MTGPLYLERQRRSSKNWLVHRIHDAALEARLREHARGCLVDIGCGDKPYAPLAAPYVDRHIGLDHPGSGHGRGQVDLFALAYDTALAPDSIDTVLCTFVLEHLEDPARALAEMRRILKPGGTLILSAPQSWHVHEAPRDFYRYTRYGLQHLMEDAGLRVVEVTPLAGFAVTFLQEAVYVLERRGHGILRLPFAVLRRGFQRLGWMLHRWDRSYEFTWAYLAVAKKDA
ncbi:MAG: methyltransferase domain-containing protein [Gemmatimonadota bacterium]